MGRLLSIDVHCDKCDETYDLLVDYDNRNDEMLCDRCGGGHARRVFATVNVSTSKTSATIPDDVAHGRFDKFRDQQQIKKELSAAKKRYKNNPNEKTREEVTRLRKEKKKVESI